GPLCEVLGALASVASAYSRPIGVYKQQFPGLAGLDIGFLGATDTVVRSFMGTFSELAKRYGIYMIGSADVPPFQHSFPPPDRAAFADPDLHPRSASVYVATAPTVYNWAFMWGPRDVRSTGPDVLRNAVASNRKVPLTPIEQALSLTPGPAHGAAAVANLRPY